MQHEEIYQELFQAIKEETANISKKVSQNVVCENMEERFAVFYYESNGNIGSSDILLENIRIIRYIVEHELISSTLKEICIKKDYSYKELKLEMLKFGPFLSHINIEALIEHNLNPKSSCLSYIPSPFHEWDITLQYSEWKKIAPLKKRFEERELFCSRDATLKNLNFKDISYNTFKSIYYIYFGFYDGYFANKIAEDFKNGNSTPYLHLEDNKDVLKHIEKISKKHSKIQKHIVLEEDYPKSQSIIFRLPPCFQRDIDKKIQKLAEELVRKKYIYANQKTLFEGLFIDNETKDDEDRRIIWNGNSANLKFLFSKLLIKENKTKVPPDTWTKVAEFFLDSEGNPYAHKTFSSKDNDKVLKYTHDQVRNDIEDIIEIVKNWPQ